MSGYTLVDTFPSGSGFFDRFTFLNGRTNGEDDFALYQSRANATMLGLISSDPNSPTIIRVDNSSVLAADAIGRPSIRIHSIQTVTTGLYVFDIGHVPVACGTWPALWFKKTSVQDPTATEIDVYETIDFRKTNGIGFYSNGNCSASTQSSQLLNLTQTTLNCGIDPKNRAALSGCNYNDLPISSAGTGFNQQGGGVYAMEMTSNYMNYYYWPRSQIPSDLTSGNPNPSGWGKPYINFQFDCCSPDLFQGLNLIINTNICGEWAGTAKDAECASLWSGEKACNSYIAAHPETLSEAYWAFNSVKIYQKAQDPFAPNPSVTCPAGSVVTATLKQSSIVPPTPAATRLATTVIPIIASSRTIGMMTTVVPVKSTSKSAAASLAPAQSSMLVGALLFWMLLRRLF
ncbi:concanavalin A-like lectin/glucanase domain-containing protein [Polychytrium aggregatum]|uniref:concanavalin A-like lectin/glucanase domain-containing protein n=1 Tax=Polychytrium aggregatum TaxID=110093 RepID=UPI0022FDC978|nr:concanavalin A-like lectin/glucanase domain-containing protein [Polychytrium aggregatum]KAI9199286.1 concanavalin A-like lectin/glucanase domain-containing protein [Polychytrium aggregatum]